MIKIPFNKPFLNKKDFSSVLRVMKSGDIAGNGPIGAKVEILIEKLFNIKFAFLTTSCSHALEMALMALDIKEGDEVILPSFSFVSAANAIVRLKAKPVFMDIEDSYLNIDPKLIKKSITAKTRAIICIHYAGFSCAMEEIIKIAEENNLYVIEDAAQAVGSKYKGRFLGTIADIGCFSFHATKNFTCGEGGAFLTNNKKIAERAEIIREKGTNRAVFLRGEVDRYTWVDIGSSYVVSDILAAMLAEQLKRIPRIISIRKDIGLKYLEGLKELERLGKITLPMFPENDFNWHIFYFRVNNVKQRDCIIHRLRKKGIEATFHFVPLHIAPYAKKIYGYREGDFPVTERASSTLIRLPIYPDLSNKEQEYIIKAVNSIIL